MNQAPATTTRPCPAWFTLPRPLPAPRSRLICLPHAGAGASAFFTWGAALKDSGIEVRAVQYPGRENRFAESPITDARVMTAALADAWPELAGRSVPCALFGHSMGALLAHELALELARRGAHPTPVRLFLSGRNPPDAPPRMPPIHGLPDEAFIREVAARYGNLPRAILNDPEMLALMTPILRADFTLVDTHAWSPAPPPGVPLSVLGGTEDPWTTEDELRGWRNYTAGECRVRMVAGDHFFVQKSRDEVIAAIVADLASSGQPRLMGSA